MPDCPCPALFCDPPKFGRSEQSHDPLRGPRSSPEQRIPFAVLQPPPPREGPLPSWLYCSDPKSHIFYFATVRKGPSSPRVNSEIIAQMHRSPCHICVQAIAAPHSPPGEWPRVPCPSICPPRISSRPPEHIRRNQGARAQPTRARRRPVPFHGRKLELRWDTSPTLESRTSSSAIRITEKWRPAHARIEGPHSGTALSKDNRTRTRRRHRPRPGPAAG